MSKWENLGLVKFLASQPRMRIVSYAHTEISLAGHYHCRAQKEGHHEIDEYYALTIAFPSRYPHAIPSVTETAHLIERHEDFHTYKDGSFCLGSDIRIRAIISESPRLTDFAEKVLNPFLYSVSYKILYGEFPYGDLAHGEPGLVDDYEQFFSVRGKRAVLDVLNALGRRKRVANKLPCPCTCRRRLGKCDFRFKLEEWRKLDKRSWFREHAVERFKPLEKSIKQRHKKQRKKKR